MFCACYLQAQNFNIAERYGLFTLTLTGVNTVNNNYYFIGYGQDSISPLKVHGYFIKYSHSGDLRYIRQFDDTSGIDTFTDFDGIKWNGENFVVSAHVEGTGNANKISLFKIDTNGNYSQPKNFYDATNRNQYSNKVIISNNYTYIIGGVQKQNYEVNIRLIKLDSNFSEVWIKDFGVTGKTDRSYSATQLANGNIVIGAHRYDANRVNGTRYKEQTWIFEIDTAGNMVRQFLDPDTRTGPAKGITQTADGGFVYCGRKQSYWNGNSTYYYGGTIAKLKPDFSEKEWENLVTDSLGNISSLEQIIKVSADSYVGVGNDASEPLDSSWIWTRAGLITKFNSNGKIKWKRYYFGKEVMTRYDRNYLFDLTLDQEGNFVSAGQVEQDQGPNLGWIVKLDSNGCLTPSNCGYPSLNVVEKMKLAKDIIVYPNPFSETLQIESENPIDEIQVFDVFGKLVFQNAKPTNQLEVGFLPNGIYLLKLKAANGEWVTQKVVKY